MLVAGLIGSGTAGCRAPNGAGSLGVAAPSGTTSPGSYAPAVATTFSMRITGSVGRTGTTSACSMSAPGEGEVKVQVDNQRRRVVVGAVDGGTAFVFDGADVSRTTTWSPRSDLGPTVPPGPSWVHAVESHRLNLPPPIVVSPLFADFTQATAAWPFDAFEPTTGLDPVAWVRALVEASTPLPPSQTDDPSSAAAKDEGLPLTHLRLSIDLRLLRTGVPSIPDPSGHEPNPFSGQAATAEVWLAPTGSPVRLLVRRWQGLPTTIPGQTNPGQTNPGQANPEQATPEQTPLETTSDVTFFDFDEPNEASLLNLDDAQSFADLPATAVFNATPATFGIQCWYAQRGQPEGTSPTLVSEEQRRFYECAYRAQAAAMADLTVGAWMARQAPRTSPTADGLFPVAFTTCASASLSTSNPQS